MCIYIYHIIYSIHIINIINIYRNTYVNVCSPKKIIFYIYMKCCPSLSCVYGPVGLHWRWIHPSQVLLVHRPLLGPPAAQQLRHPLRLPSASGPLPHRGTRYQRPGDHGHPWLNSSGSSALRSLPWRCGAKSSGDCGSFGDGNWQDQPRGTFLASGSSTYGDLISNNWRSTSSDWEIISNYPSLDGAYSWCDARAGLGENWIEGNSYCIWTYFYR